MFLFCTEFSLRWLLRGGKSEKEKQSQSAVQEIHTVQVSWDGMQNACVAVVVNIVTGSLRNFIRGACGCSDSLE